LDATLLYFREPNLVDRSVIDLDRDPHVRALFPDAACEGARYFQKNGLYPVNHGVAVKQSVLDQHPWVAVNLFNAFVEAKDLWEARGRDLMDAHLQTGGLALSERGVLKSDPYPYGVQANQKVLKALAGYSREQGLTPRELALEEIFAPSTLDL
jgi:4,5-dihydroxyphthalate decarboxylase